MVIIQKKNNYYYLFGTIDSDKPLDYNYILDVFDKNQYEFNLYKQPSPEVFNLFFEIMDNQKEQCPLYQAILQFNGLIKTDLFRDIDIYSGAIYKE